MTQEHSSPEFYVVMRLRPWSSLLVGPEGQAAHVTDDSGTIGFLMVFGSREQAAQYAEQGEPIVPMSALMRPGVWVQHGD